MISEEDIFIKEKVLPSKIRNKGRK